MGKFRIVYILVILNYNSEKEADSSEIRGVHI